MKGGMRDFGLFMAAAARALADKFDGRIMGQLQTRSRYHSRIEKFNGPSFGQYSLHSPRSWLGKLNKEKAHQGKRECQRRIRQGLAGTGPEKTAHGWRQKGWFETRRERIWDAIDDYDPQLWRDRLDHYGRQDGQL
jgi:hypothetical protein